MCFTIERPRPVDFTFLSLDLSTTKNLSKTLFMSALAIPMPVSFIKILSDLSIRIEELEKAIKKAKTDGMKLYIRRGLI